MPYAVATELTPAGADLLVVVDEVGRWLTEAPRNPVAVDNETAGSYIKSLAEGWASMLIGALAEEPRSLTELARDKNKGLRNTFDVVPDAPVTKFTLRMQGGKKSLLVTSRNICKRKERASVRLNGQNGRQHNFSQPLKVVNCTKKAKKSKASARKRRG